jgi:NADPH:quinone reductase-like Zn-dependent oxidoreductase
MGFLPIRMDQGWSKPRRRILGADLAGTVEAVGKNVKRLKVGDRVYGISFGAYAERAKAREKSLAVMPKNLSFVEAGALPMVALTALQTLRDLMRLGKGQKIAIVAASGGIGHVATQIAKHYGAEVTAICGAANVGWVKELGADFVVDYTREDFTRNGKTFDAIYDIVSDLTFFKVRPALARTGVYVSEHFMPLRGFAETIIAPLIGDKRTRGHLTEVNYEDLELLRDLIEAGKIKPVVGSTYPLEQIAEAHRRVEGKHGKGKVAVEVARG